MFLDLGGDVTSLLLTRLCNSMLSEWLIYELVGTVNALPELLNFKFRRKLNDLGIPNINSKQLVMSVVSDCMSTLTLL